MASHHCMGARLAERRNFLSADQKLALERVVEHIGQPGKGISACDESGRTINPRFKNVGVEPTEEHRRAYRQCLFEAEGAANYVSAAILDPETVFQKSAAGVPLTQVLTSRGILPGVKPSLTVYKLPGCDGETVMQGLDSLAERLREYRAAGAVFAKWRSPLNVDLAAGKPSQLAIEANMRDQARYALICQAEGIVPDIVVERAEVTSVESTRRTKEADLQGSLSGDGALVDAQSESEALTALRNSDNQLYEALTLLRGINLLTPEAPTEARDAEDPTTVALGKP